MSRRSRLTVPWKAVNLPQGSRGREAADRSEAFLEGQMTRTSSREDISTEQRKIAETTREAPTMTWTTLAHHIDVEWLEEAYRRTRKDGAAGVDGVTAESYEQRLQGNLTDLLGRFKSGRYRAPPVRRVHIPKEGTGKTRPIGIPTLEDKVLQRAVLMVLEPVYEQVFLPCSFGFRPGRSPHRALEALWRGLMDIGGGWVIDLDIQSFFDTVERSHLEAFLDQRVRDGVIRRTIGKWMNAGVMEEGVHSCPETGVPQGGVLSPLMSNLYLHEVLDLWFEHEVKPRMGGRAFMVRFADDAVLAFEREEDAQRVLAALPKRFARFGLTLHPEKTRLVDFRCPPQQGTGGSQRGSSFDMLGFTHHWGRSRKGRWVVQRRTAKSRFSRALRRIGQWCQSHRHLPVADQQKALGRKLRGHCAYYGITGNAKALSRFRFEVQRRWRKWLNRRSHAGRLTREAFHRLCSRYPLPPMRVVHSIFAT
jgi:RNA-directed DNA polymerase